MFYFKDQIVDYICRGRVSGAFMHALAVGDLYVVIQKADDTNKLQIVQLAEWIFSHAPTGCYGSADNVREWNQKGGLEGIAGTETMNRWKVINDID